MKKQLLKSFTLAMLAVFGICSNAQAQKYILNVGDKVSDESGTYIVKGENLITNPSFDNGTTDWYGGDGKALSDSYFDVPSEGGADGGAYLKALSSSGSGKAQSIKTSWSIDANKTYVLHFWALRPTLDNNVQYSKIFLGSTSKQIASVSYVAGTWNENTIVFESGEYTSCIANFGWLGNGCSFDCFTLAEVELSDELNTDNLDKEIATAQTLLDETTEGTAKGEYRSEVRQTLKDAIAAAQTVLANATTQTELNDAVTALRDAENAYKGSANPPFSYGVNYTITQSSGSVLGYSESNANAVLCNMTGDATQQFLFEASTTASAYYIKNVGSGKYLAKSTSSNWNTCWVDEAGTNETMWTIAEYGENIYNIKNVANSSCLGSDANSDGSATYCDKAASAANSQWTISECSAKGIINSAIAEAQKLIDETEVGTEYYQVPQSAVDELNAAINAAKASVETATIEEATQISADLQAAMEKFSSSFNPMSEFDTSLTYTVTHYGGCMLTSTASGNATITSPDETGKPNDSQKIYLESAGEPLTYYIKSSDDTYLAINGTYDTKWTAEKDSTCIFTIKQLSGKYLGLYNTGKGAYFGTDATTSGAMIYSDKQAVANSYWTIESFEDINLDKTLFNAALEKVQEFKASMVEGNQIDQYLPEVVSEYASVISSYQSKAKKAQSQEELDQIAKDLEATIDTYKAKANTESIIVRTQLTAAIATAEKTLNTTVAGDCNGNYPQSAVDAYQKVLDAAKAVNDDTSKTQEEIDAATTSLNDAAKEFAQTKVVIDFSSLSSAISAAKQTITDNEKYKGEGPGSYPTSAFDALQSVIDEASTYVNSTTQNQSAVDAETAKVNVAVETFKSTWVDMDRSELTALLDALKKFRDNTTITLDSEDKDALDHAISVGEDAMNATTQSEIDFAVKLLSREYSYFDDLATAITEIKAGNTVEGIAIYSVSGARLQTALKGINILRLANGKTVKIMIK